MVHDLLAIQSRLRIRHEYLADEIFSFWRNGGPGGRVKVILAPLDLLKECEVVFIVEGWCA